MKVKNLIKKLQAIDPTGEMNVTVGKADIYTVYKLPHYYDGNCQRLILDEAMSGYNIIGAEFPREDHIEISTVSMKWMLLDDPEAPIECYGNKELEKRVEEWRQEMRKINGEIEEDERRDMKKEMEDQDGDVN